MHDSLVLAITVDARQRSLQIASQSSTGDMLAHRTLGLEDHKRLIDSIMNGNHMEPIVLTPPTPLISSLGEALDIDLPSPVTVFPLRTKDNSLGVFGIVVDQSKVIDRSLMNGIQEFTNIFALCLESYQTNEQQARQLRELSMKTSRAAPSHPWLPTNFARL